MEPALLAAIVAGALSGVLAAWAYCALSLRNSLQTERETMRGLLERARLDLTTANDQLEQWSERGARERARVEQSERRMKGPAQPPTQRPFADARSYQRHLERGGSRDVAFERELGWTGKLDG
jgi:hypothetical protein